MSGEDLSVFFPRDHTCHTERDGKHTCLVGKELKHTVFSENKLFLPHDPRKEYIHVNLLQASRTMGLMQALLTAGMKTQYLKINHFKVCY